MLQEIAKKSAAAMEAVRDITSPERRARKERKKLKKAFYTGELRRQRHEQSARQIKETKGPPSSGDQDFDTHTRKVVDRRRSTTIERPEMSQIIVTVISYGDASNMMEEPEIVGRTASDPFNSMMSFHQERVTL